MRRKFTTVNITRRMGEYYCIRAYNNFMKTSTENMLAYFFLICNLLNAMMFIEYNVVSTTEYNENNMYYI